MNIHHVELFYYVARHGGISRAVRHMPYGIQQPAVSSQILLLEQDLGVKLFDRQPFRLTAEGQELYDFARPFFDRVEEIGNRLRNTRAPQLRVAAAEIVLREYLPPVIRELKKQQPDVRFSLRSGQQRAMEGWLQDGQIDLAITPLDSRPQAGLKCFPLVKLPLVLLVPESSSLKSAAQLWSQDRIEDALICLSSTESVCRLFSKGLRQLKVEWPVSVEASSLGLVTEYVAHGYGIGVSVNLPNLVKQAKVRVIPLPGFDAVEVAVLWRPPSTPLQEALLAVIRDRARELWPAK